MLMAEAVMETDGKLGASALVAAVGTLIIPPILNGFRAWLADRAKARRDNEQTELFRKMHDEQVTTRMALTETNARGDERWSAFKDTNKQQHEAVMQAIEGVCRHPNAEH